MVNVQKISVWCDQVLRAKVMFREVKGFGKGKMSPGLLILIPVSMHQADFFWADRGMCWKGYPFVFTLELLLGLVLRQ